MSLFFLFLISLLKVSFSQECPDNEIFINSACRCLPPNVRVDGSCRPNCPPLTFLDLKKYSCEPCDSSCAECWGPAPNQCLSCAAGPSGTYLFNPFLGTCETSGTCQQGTNGGRGFCVGTAATCSGLSSDTPFINAASGACISTCNIPYDVLGSNENPYNLCGFDQCDASCGINPDTQKRHCLAQWNPGSCLWCNGRNAVTIHIGVASNGQDIYNCATAAPTNSYYSTEEGRYYMCSPQCSSCSGAPDNCIRCEEGLTLSLNGTCIQECPPGTSSGTNEFGQRACIAIQEEEEPEPPVEEPEPPVEEPEPPVEEPEPPVEEPETPVEEPETPVEEPETPVEEPEPPVEEPEPPVEEPEPPVEEPEPPVEEPEPPVQEPELPVEEQDPPVVEPERPVEQPPGQEPIVIDQPRPIHVKNERQEPLSESVVKYNNAGGTTLSVGVAGLQAISPGSPSVVSTILLVNLLQYVRYLSINYPKNLEGTFKQQTQDIGTLNFGPMVPDSVVNEVSDYKAAQRFNKFGVCRFFLVNFWRGITTSLILALGVGIVFLIRRVTFKNEIVKMVQEQLVSFILWNFILTFILSNLDNVSIFSIVEYQTLKLDNAFAIISFMLNLVCLIASLLLLAYIPRRLYQLRKKDPYKKLDDKLKEHGSIKVLFEKFKNQYFVQEILLFVIGVRTVLNNVIIAAFDSPTVQCSLLIVISLAMLAYLIIFRPNVEILSNIEIIVYEIIILIVNCTCLYLSTIDSSEQANAETAGTVILTCNIVAMTFSLVICVLKIVVQGLTILKQKLAERKAQKRAEKKQTDIEGILVIPNESINLDLKAAKDLNMLSSRNKLNTGPDFLVREIPNESIDLDVKVTKESKTMPSTKTDINSRSDFQVIDSRVIDMK